jgi:hypothetical protein
MSNIILLIVSLLAFSFIARKLGQEILSKKHHFPFRTEYSYTALRMERGYKFIAYGIMLAILFYSFVACFLQVLTNDPF